MRDMAAALGTTTALLCQCKRFADVPKKIFETRLEEAFRNGQKPTARFLLHGVPVRARGRVECALSLYRAMTPEERRVFRSALHEAGA